MGVILVIGMFLISLIPYIIGVVLVGITFWLINTKSVKSRIAKILLGITVFLFVFILIFNFNDERTDYLYREMKEISDNETLIGLSKEEVVNILGEPIDVEHKFYKCSAVQFLNPINYERCKAFIETNDPHIIRYFVKPYKDKQIENSLDRLGFIIVQADSMEELENLILKIK